MAIQAKTYPILGCMERNVKKTFSSRINLCQGPRDKIVWVQKYNIFVSSTLKHRHVFLPSSWPKPNLGDTQNASILGCKEEEERIGKWNSQD